MAKNPIVFIHGLWMHSSTWKPWMQFFNQHGYETLNPDWPGDGATVEASRANAKAIATHDGCFRIPALNTLILMAKPRGLSENARLRNRFQARCKKVVRRSKRRTGRSYCRRASPILMKLRGKRSPSLAKRTGHPFTLSFDVVATRRLTRKISSRVFLFIYLNRTR